MTYPRAHLVDEANGGFYHCISRCVRRAWLCGRDELTGRSFDHRRAWLEDRLLTLSQCFAVKLYSYAVMSNHYHLVIELTPDVTSGWSSEEVATRWLTVTASRQEPTQAQIDALLLDDDRIAVLRQRLGSLSWFMRYMNEPLARRANAEDQCTGRFWEGRFKSIALLDDAAIQNCMAYVDLNPYRAHLADGPEQAHYTSVRRRITQSDDRLAPVEQVGIELTDYVALLNWTIAVDRGERTDIPATLEAQLSTLDQTPLQWLGGVRAHRLKYRAYGLQRSLDAYCRKLRQRWIRRPSIA